MGNLLIERRREIGSAGISHYFAEPVSQISEPEPSPIDDGEACVVNEPISTPRAAALVTPPFVGREIEMGGLLAALDLADAGRGRLVLVTGEPGIGKSRLMDEFSQVAVQLGWRVLFGRCWEGGGAPAYWPWMQVVQQAGGQFEQLTPRQENQSASGATDRSSNRHERSGNRPFQALRIRGWIPDRSLAGSTAAGDLGRRPWRRRTLAAVAQVFGRSRKPRADPPAGLLPGGGPTCPQLGGRIRSACPSGTAGYQYED